jgi:hypothetical protein
MPAGKIRVWIDGVSFESEYVDQASRQKEITRTILANAILKSHIEIDIIPNTELKEHNVSEETKKGGYSWQLWNKNVDMHTHKKNAWKTHKRPGSKTKKGICFKCIGLSVYSLSDSNSIYSLAI